VLFDYYLRDRTGGPAPEFVVRTSAGGGDC
jgi:hypothetical protein